MLTSKKIRLLLTGTSLVICLSLLIPLLWAAPDQPLGTISGRVTRDGGVPAAGVTVTAFPAVRPFLQYTKDNPNTAVTDADGWYTIILRPMHPIFLSGPMLPEAKGFSVFVSNGGQPYIEPPAQTADPASTPDHIIKGLDFLLRLGPQVTVRARDAITGTPVPGLSIQAEDQIGRRTAEGITGPDGTLSLRVPLTEFRLRADIPDGQKGVLQDAPGYSFYRQVKATPGEEFAWNLKTYGQTRDSNWHGTVLGPDGRPAGNIPVTILRPSYQGDVTSLITDREGRFSTQLPRIDAYETPVVMTQRGNSVATQTVTPEESWDGMTLRLAPSASLSGQLTTAQGRPAAGMIVSLSATLSHNQWTATPTAITDEQGRFTLGGLPPGDYEVRAHGGNFSDLVIPDRPSNALTAGPYLTLRIGHHLDLGCHVVLTADQELTGSVVDEQGNSAPSLCVGVTGDHTHETTVTLQDGTFHVYHLATEPLKVTVGVPGHDITAEIAPGQKTVRLVVHPDVIAANGPPSPSPHPVPPARSGPTGPLEIAPTSRQILLNGLRLVISPGGGGAFTAAIDQPNPLDLLMATGGYSFTGGFPKPVTTLSGPLWSGPLVDVDGMRLTVRQDQGSLADRKGRVLWSGRVWTPPNYTVVSEAALAHTPARTTVIDAQGKTLWSGVVAPDVYSLVTGDDDLRIIGTAHDVAWERPVGDGGVAFVEGDPHDLWSRIGPLDGTLTLHLGAATATLRSSDGHVLASVPTPVVTTEDTFPAAPTIKIGADGIMTPAFLAWSRRRQFLCSPKTTLLVTVRNALPESTLTLTDSTGHPLRYRLTFP